jgi:pimeloyl-ACP methyl ester carboxylesterase
MALVEPSYHVDQFQGVRSERLSPSYRCILFDHRGHGESDHPSSAEANHIERYAADVLALLDHLGVESAAFWGYSNGIAVGLRVADGHPSRLDCLIGSGRLSKTTREQLADAVPRTVTDYREHGWETLIAGFVAEEGELPPWMEKRIRATDLGPVIGWTEARLNWGWSVWDALPRVTAPTLFLVGELEDPQDTMAKAAALMPHGERVRVPGRGHINGFLDVDFVLPRIQAFQAARRVSSTSAHPR